MSKSLLFLPDISGFTEFVQTTEVSHSQHVISELLEVLVKANTQNLQLAEIEGDALFFFKEEIPSQEKLLAQVETMFTAFYGHLKLLEKNRICPCNACASAPNLKLKIIAHSGAIEFLAVQDNRKPFGTAVIQAHRLLKNSVQSDSYVLLSDELIQEIDLPEDYQSKLFSFQKGSDNYDKKKLKYLYSYINKENLKLKPFKQAKELTFDCLPNLRASKNFNIPAPRLLEYITNYSYRHYWVDGVNRFEYNEHEVTRIGTEHACVINDKHLNFITVTKRGQPGQLIYGEHTKDPSVVDDLFQFYSITPLTNTSCKLDAETYWTAKSPIKKLLITLVAKKTFKKNLHSAVQKLYDFIEHEKPD